MPNVAFNYFDCFVGDLGLKLHNLNTDTLKVYLSNEQPLAADTVYKANGGGAGGPDDLITENGYTAGGEDSQNTYSQTGGVGTCGGTDIEWTATAANDATGIGPFKFAVLYNFSATGKNLIGWWEYPSNITALEGEKFTFDVLTSLFTLSPAA